MKNCLILISSLLILGCSTISVINKKEQQQQDRAEFYSQNFLKEIASIKNIFKAGNFTAALDRLAKMNDQKLMPAEIGLKENLRGVIYFSKEDYNQALGAFFKAKKPSSIDQLLHAQVLLNLASVYYKQNNLKASLEELKAVDVDLYNDAEREKYYRLYISTAKGLNQKEDHLKGLVGYLSRFDSLTTMRQESFYGELESLYRSVESETRQSLRSDEQTPRLMKGYLNYLESRLQLSVGEKSLADRYREVVRDDYQDISELQALINQVEERIEINSKITPLTVGVILPLTGERASFGQRVLKGIDSALRLRQDGLSTENIQLVVKDSQSQAIIGESAARELIHQDHVSLIIGGLFSDEAESQYLIAKKSGVFYLSLAQIYFNEEFKTELLLEIPGSIQSQLKNLFTKEAIARFGTRGAILYPNDQRGFAYLNEFWRQSQAAGVTITDAMPYELGPGVDYRLPIQKILGLQFPRERSEEYRLLKEIHTLEEKKSMRRLQTLPPVQDFDWVFIPSRPLEAAQIIPSFSYFDSFKPALIGDSSWRSRTISELSHKYRKLYFLGDEIELSQTNLNEVFFTNYKTPFRVLEMRGYDSLSLALQIFASGTYSDREDFNQMVRSVGKLQGLGSVWTLENGAWIKNMSALHFRAGKIQ